MSADEVREIEPSEWVAAVTAARDAGFDVFDWLTGVDRTYDEAAPGFEVGIPAWVGVEVRVLLRVLGVHRIGGAAGVVRAHIALVLSAADERDGRTWTRSGRPGGITAPILLAQTAANNGSWDKFPCDF